MPKDIIHFKIAELTADRLRDTAFAPCLAEHTDALLLGSVFHDALFYAVTPGGKPLESLSHALHGADGQDTFDLIRMQVATAAAADHGLPGAVLVGMVSHLQADAVMHPMVWHLTGNYYSDNPAERSATRQRHRALESLMDMTACPGMLCRARYSMRRMLRRTPDLIGEGLPVEELAQRAGMNGESAQAQLATAWSIFSLFQSAYCIRPLARALFALMPLLPASLTEIATLFYAPQLNRQAARISGAIEYRHPVSGEPARASLDDLMKEAADRAAALCRTLEPAVFQGATLDLDSPGPSMDAGIPGVPATDMRHFADPPFPALK